MKRTTDKF